MDIVGGEGGEKGNIGGLQIPHPEETSEGLHLNFMQKYSRKMNDEQHTKYTHVIEQVLRRAGRPDLNKHVNKMGPGEWMKTSTKISNVNPMLREAFKSMANFLKKTEES